MADKLEKMVPLDGEKFYVASMIDMANGDMSVASIAETGMFCKDLQALLLATREEIDKFEDAGGNWVIFECRAISSLGVNTPEKSEASPNLSLS